ncbi:MAG: hypothetical protein ABR899_10790 [Candidatus Krumholzibacteriaceae bacterium]
MTPAPSSIIARAREIEGPAGKGHGAGGTLGGGEQPLDACAELAETEGLPRELRGEPREPAPVGDDIDARFRRAAGDDLAVHGGVPAEREELLLDDVRDGGRDEIDAQDDRLGLLLDDGDAVRIDARLGESARERPGRAGRDQTEGIAHRLQHSKEVHREASLAGGLGPRRLS